MDVAQCMATIEERMPGWLTRSPPTREAVLFRIAATVRILAGESRQILDSPEQAHPEIQEALKKADGLGKAVKGLVRRHSALAAGDWGDGQGFSRRERAREFFSKHGLGAAYDTGLDFDGFQAALAGFVQRLSEIEEIGRARKGARVRQLEIELFIDLSDILDKAKENPLVTFEKKESDIFLDEVVGAITQHFPDVAFRRPHDKTLKRHQAKDLKQGQK